MEKNHPEIRILPDEVVNQIAAGEVVERPASVVKELIENSLDAGATRIHLEVSGSGKSLIQVSDNGYGMSRDDLLQAIERHATSKLRRVEDLKGIATFGFRGEALPSIASVSRLRIVSGREGEPSGTELGMEGGTLKYVRDAPPVPGTTIAVKDLFFNTPARKKFLRSNTTESQHVLDKFIQQALAHPEVHFRLTHDRKTIIDAFPTTDPAGRAESLLQRTTTSELIEIRSSRPGGVVSVRGNVSRPTFTRASMTGQYIYVNGRFVRDRLIGRAVMESYRSMLPRGRYPMVILFVEVPSSEVDVNVHPTKSEVRFFHPEQVYGAVLESLRETLEEHRYSPPPEAGLGEKKIPPPVFFPERRPPLGKTTASVWAGGAGLSPETESPEPIGQREESPAGSQKTGTAGYAPLPPRGEGKPSNLLPENPPRLDGPVRFTQIDPSFSDRLVPLGQAFKTFIVLEDEDRLLFLDQHTAHERVLYEKFTKKYRESRVDRQDLLFPINLELSKRDSAALQNQLGLLKDLGFEIEPFGGETYIIRTIPSLLIGQDPKSVILDVIEKSEQVGGKVTFDELVQELILIFSCRGAVKANQTLDRKEILTLVHELEKATLPYSCPHGRPIALSLEKRDLLKGFFRI